MPDAFASFGSRLAAVMRREAVVFQAVYAAVFGQKEIGPGIDIELEGFKCLVQRWSGSDGQSPPGSRAGQISSVMPS